MGQSPKKGKIMSNSERASYIRGLMDGMELDPNAKETKIFNAIMELLSELCTSVDELEDEVDGIADQLDEVDEDLGTLESEYYGIDKDSCGCGGHHHQGGCGCGHHHAEFEVICPSCGETIGLTEEMLDEDSMVCPNCGETLEFDFDEDEEETEPEEEPVEDSGE